MTARAIRTRGVAALFDGTGLLASALRIACAVALAAVAPPAAAATPKAISSKAVQVRRPPELHLHLPVFAFENRTQAFNSYGVTYLGSFYDGSESPYRFVVSISRRDNVVLQGVKVTAKIGDVEYPMQLTEGNLLGGTQATYSVQPPDLKGCVAAGAFSYRVKVTATTNEVVGYKVINLEPLKNPVKVPIWRTIDEASPLYTTKVEGAAAPPYFIVRGPNSGFLGCWQPRTAQGFFVEVRPGESAGTWAGELFVSGWPNTQLTLGFRGMAPAGHKVTITSVVLTSAGSCDGVVVLSNAGSLPATLDCEQQTSVTLTYVDAPNAAACFDAFGLPGLVVKGRVEGPQAFDFTLHLTLWPNAYCAS